jgi:excisionase family DNA binding protein
MSDTNLLTIERPLTTDQVAELLGVCRHTVIRQIRSGALPANKFGRAWRVPAAAVHAIVEGSAE